MTVAGPRPQTDMVTTSMVNAFAVNARSGAAMTTPEMLGFGLGMLFFFLWLIVK